MIPARIVKCKCGKLITLDALTIRGVNCPECNATHTPLARGETPKAKYPEQDN